MMIALLRSRTEQIVLGSAPLRIGSAPDNQLVFNDSSVEPYHAELYLSGDGYNIVDLSRNSGTFVNRQRLDPNAPQILQNGDRVYIGNVELIYEVTSGLAVLPTTPSLASSNDAGYSPGVLKLDSPPPPPPYTPMLGSPASDPYASLPPAAPSPFLLNNISSPSASDPYEPLSRKRGHRTLWIVLGSIGCIIALPIIIFVFILFGGLAILFFAKGPDTTPTQALQAYCSAVKAHDARTAYNMYSSDAQKQNSFLQIQQRITMTTDCTVSNVNDTNATGTVTYTLTDGGKISDRETLVNQENGWKITAIQPVPTPTLTLYTYCSALIKSDYQAAYNQFTTAGQSQWDTEQQFATGFPSDKLTACSISNANDNTGDGSITLVFPGGKLMFNEQLVNTGSAWKINHEQRTSTPTLTLTTYCNALKQKDYQTAYNQVSSATMAQLQESELEFANSFTLTSVTNCSVGNTNDTAGTGAISFTYSDNTRATIAYILKQENGVWKLKAETTPTSTLDSYCSALKQKDYQTAYSQLSHAQQAAQTESQFASNFHTTTVKDCSVSRSDDTAGTGSISYTLSNGSKVTADYVLVQEDGSWKIQSEKAL